MTGSRSSPTDGEIVDASKLLRILKRGESEQLEFVSRLPNDEIVARILTAFANSAGGTLVMGVEDSGEVIGLSDSQMAIGSVRVSNVAEQLLPHPVRMEPVVVDGLSVLIVYVPAAPEHLRPVRTAAGDVFIRKGERIARQKQNLVPGTHPLSTATVTLFVAMSFRFEEEPALVDYYEAMKRAVKASGFPISIVRMDIEEGDFEVSREINQRIIESDVLLADFTLNSPNVYFEAGVARGAGKYTIRTARQGTDLPFDVRTWKTVFYSNATQLEAALAAPLRAAYETLTSSAGPISKN